MIEYALRRNRKFQDMGFSMSRHSALCRDNGARHYVVTRLGARDRDALSRQCGAALRRDRVGHACTKNQARLGAHDKGILWQQRNLCHNRLLTMVKKNTPLGIGASHCRFPLPTSPSLFFLPTLLLLSSFKLLLSSGGFSSRLSSLSTLLFSFLMRRRVEQSRTESRRK